MLGVRNIVLASSISALGLAYRHRDFNSACAFLLTKHIPCFPRTATGYPRLVGEELAEGYVRRTPELAVTSLRFTWVLDRGEHRRSPETPA